MHYGSSHIIHAPLVVQAHAVTVVPAFVLGTWLLLFSLAVIERCAFVDGTADIGHRKRI
jgi:uncharacterized membrane protein